MCQMPQTGIRPTRRAYTVGQVNTYIKNMFVQDFMLNHIYVKGEVSNCKYHTSGHIYFSLKDETGTLSCVMFAGNRKGLSFRMQEGQDVLVLGSVSVYERDGKYQLYAREIMLDGEGLLYQKFLALKRELEEMGMFDACYKQPIPKYIRRLGVVTAPTGAAIQDIRNISHRRNPFVQIILYPALVQGEGAAGSVAKGIRLLDELGVDTIIVGRGGGSMEDLWAFNEEIVARAIFECRTPIISAVGHETDTTIADYAADLRAPTPSAAAELAVADVRQLLDQLTECHRQLNRLLMDRIVLAGKRCEQYELRLTHASPQNQIREKRQQAAQLTDQLEQLMEQKLEQKRHALDLYVRKLEGLSPLERLKQGFSYTADSAGRAVTDIGQVEPGDPVKIYVANGRIDAVVKEKTAIRK